MSCENYIENNRWIIDASVKKTLKNYKDIGYFNGKNKKFYTPSQLDTYVSSSLFFMNTTFNIKLNSILNLIWNKNNCRNNNLKLLKTWFINFLLRFIVLGIDQQLVLIFSFVII